LAQQLQSLQLVAQIKMLQRLVEQQRAAVLRPQLRETRALTLTAGQRRVWPRCERSQIECRNGPACRFFISRTGPNMERACGYRPSFT
jgi:hypothetical protein